MSCPPTSPRADSDSSDYGSDFTPDEEEVLNELLSQAVAQHATVATPTSTGHIPATPTPALEDASASASASTAVDLEPLQPAVLDALVADIEDAVEDVPGVRVPKVLGREKPRSPWRQASRRSPFGFGGQSPFGAGSWRAIPGADNGDSPSGMWLPQLYLVRICVD